MENWTSTGEKWTDSGDVIAYHHQLPPPMGLGAFGLPGWYSRGIHPITKASLSVSADFPASSKHTYPVTTLPAMKWPKLKAEHCKAAPITMIAEPRNIVLRRPSISPIQIVATAPQKHPKL